MTERPPAPAGLVVAAVLMTMSSAFGQTYFIAIFAPQLKGELGLSDGGFGGLYAVATVASACALMWAGKIADRFRIRWLGAAALLMLAAMCIAMASVSAAWALLPILFGLRLFGQGSVGQLAITGVGRWYVPARQDDVVRGAWVSHQPGGHAFRGSEPHRRGRMAAGVACSRGGAGPGLRAAGAVPPAR